MWLKFFILSTAVLCMACGNADMGAQAKLKAKSAANASAQGIALAQGTEATCKAFTVYANGDAFFGQLFAGSSICYAAASQTVTQLKATSYSAGSRYCLVPIRGEIAGTESCFTTNTYVTTVNLQSSGYTSLVLVPEIYVTAYKMYLNGQSTSAPPLAVSIQ